MASPGDATTDRVTDQHIGRTRFFSVHDKGRLIADSKMDLVERSILPMTWSIATPSTTSVLTFNLEPSC